MPLTHTQAPSRVPAALQCGPGSPSNTCWALSLRLRRSGRPVDRLPWGTPRASCSRAVCLSLWCPKWPRLRFAGPPLPLLAVVGPRDLLARPHSESPLLCCVRQQLPAHSECALGAHARSERGPVGRVRARAETCRSSGERRQPRPPHHAREHIAPCASRGVSCR